MADSLGTDPVFQQRLARALGPEFEILRLLGRGGFADVYEIRELKLERTLAIKVLRPETAWGPWMVSRFEREARALASLNHLNIPPVHFVGDNEGLVYYVMPMIAGQSLADILAASGPMASGALVDVMIPVLDALHHAHHLGIVHRDIKPDNIIIEEGSSRPLLVDFGVAKQVRVTANETSLPGIIMGTPGYISPEQAIGQNDIDGRSDVYAVGATMFHMLTGTTVFPGEPSRDILGQQITSPPPQAKEVNPAVPAWLSEVVSQALTPDRRDRFQSAAEMAEALRAGQRSGAFASPVLQHQVEQIREDDPTPPMVRATAPTPQAVRATAPVTPPWNRRSIRRGRRRTTTRSSVFSWSLYLGLAGVTSAYFLLIPVTLDLKNNLLLPVEVSIEDGGVRTIPSAGSLSLKLPADGRMVGRWFGVQPVIGSNQPPAGEPVSGVFRIDGLTASELLLRRVRRSIDSWTDGSIIFAPRVRNFASQPVRVTVGRGGGVMLHCDCLVSPGEERLLGYYRLESASFVRIESARSKSVVFRNLESRIDLNTGMVDLLVNDTLLSRFSDR